MEDALCVARGERAHDLDAVPDPDRRADVRRVREHHQHAGRPEDPGLALQPAPDHGGRVHHGDLRGARHGDGGALDDPAHRAGVLPAHRPSWPRPDLVRHPHRRCGGDRPYQPAGGNEPLRPQHHAAARAYAHHLPRRAALHGRGLRAPRHPGGISDHLALPAEPDEVAPAGPLCVTAPCEAGPTSAAYFSSTPWAWADFFCFHFFLLLENSFFEISAFKAPAPASMTIRSPVLSSASGPPTAASGET